MMQMYYDFLKQPKKKEKILKCAKKTPHYMLQQRKNGYPTPCYISTITDEQSAVYAKHVAYSQDFRTTPY